MVDSNENGFGKFIPGFDFLQNLAKGASQTVPHMPNLGNWVAPTLNEEELDKRIADLKAVHFWLDQNSRALGATVQALEVQKMTLATLKGMNLNISELANAFKPKPSESSAPAAVHKAPEKPAVAVPPVDVATVKPTEEPPKPVAGATPPGMVDPMQLWSSLTQQFQQIAASAMKEASKAAAAIDMSKGLAKGAAAKSGKTAKAEPAAPAKKRAAVKKAVKKSAPSAGTERGVRRS